jgi:hypothetical protein
MHVLILLRKTQNILERTKDARDRRHARDGGTEGESRGTKDRDCGIEPQKRGHWTS